MNEHGGVSFLSNQNVVDINDLHLLDVVQSKFGLRFPLVSSCKQSGNVRKVSDSVENLRICQVTLNQLSSPNIILTNSTYLSVL